MLASLTSNLLTVMIPDCVFCLVFWAGGVKRLPAPLASPSKLGQTAKAGTPVRATGSTLTGKGSESESSGSSDSEAEETPAALKQPLKGSKFVAFCVGIWGLSSSFSSPLGFSLGRG